MSQAASYRRVRNLPCSRVQNVIAVLPVVTVTKGARETAVGRKWHRSAPATTYLDAATRAALQATHVDDFPRSLSCNKHVLRSLSHLGHGCDHGRRYQSNLNEPTHI